MSKDAEDSLVSVCFRPEIVLANGRENDGEAGHGPVHPLQVTHAVVVETLTFTLIFFIQLVLKSLNYKIIRCP